MLRVASEPLALLAMGHQAGWNEAAVEALFTHQYLLPNQTIFDGIQCLEPGSWMSAEAGSVPQIGRWLEWTGEQVAPPPSAEETRAELSRAVAERCQADQPVACQLSGGIDSAVVAALASQRGVRVAYTVQFVGDRGWDEAGPAGEIAGHLGLDHRVLSLDQDTLLRHFDAAVVASGGPVINTHAPAKWLLCQQVRRDGHAVLLTGEGADELFWGYEHLIADHATAEGLTARAPSPAVAVHLPLGPRLDTALVHRAWGHTPSFLQAKASLGVRLRAVSSLSPQGDFFTPAPGSRKSALGTSCHRLGLGVVTAVLDRLHPSAPV